MKATLAIYAIQDINDSFSEYIHDHNFTLAQNGKIKTYYHQERITGHKYDNNLHKSLYDTLKQGKIIKPEYDIVFVDSVIGKNFISQEGKIRFEVSPFSYPGPEPVKGRAFWLDGFHDAYLVSHELAHIFSAVPFYGMFRDNSLLIHFDGGASESNFSAWTWKNEKLDLIDYHWNAKHLSSLFNANALNFFILGVKRKEHNSLAGKYMGFSGLGKYDKEIEKWLIENDFFEDIWHEKKHFFKKAKDKFGWSKNNFDTHDTFLQNIAATVQHFFTRETVKLISGYQKQTETRYLYYTGGSALSLYTNTALYQSKIFKDIFIPPATNDSGLSLGAAAFMEWKKGNKIEKNLPYLGNWQLESTQTIYPNDNTLERIAALIAEGKVIGIYNGWSEAGPRALGNRSIIGRPDSKELAKKISMQMKGREWYRPVAPIMLEETAKEVTNLKEIPEAAKYMLLNFKIKPQYIKDLQGVIHADGTSRIQVLFSENDNPFIYNLLKKLNKNYGIKALINTSFNAKGKPIVHFEDQAIAQAKEMKLDFLVVNGELW